MVNKHKVVPLKTFTATTNVSKDHISNDDIPYLKSSHE